MWLALWLVVWGGRSDRGKLCTADLYYRIRLNIVFQPVFIKQLNFKIIVTNLRQFLRSCHDKWGQVQKHENLHKLGIQVVLILIDGWHSPDADTSQKKCNESYLWRVIRENFRWKQRAKALQTTLRNLFY